MTDIETGRTRDAAVMRTKGVRDALEEAIAVHREMLAGSVTRVIEVADLLVDRFGRGGRLYLVGNGGSAAEAQHIATEFIVRFQREREPLPAMALTSDPAVLTAMGNDFEFETIFSRQVRALAGPDDVLVALSTSGASANVLKAVRAAGDAGATTVGFTGNRRGELTGLVDVCVEVPSADTQRIQEAHLVLWHVICDLVDRAFAPANVVADDEQQL